MKHGKAHEYVNLPKVVAVETDRSGALWAATLGNENPPAPGTLVKIVKVSANPQPLHRAWARETAGKRHLWIDPELRLARSFLAASTRPGVET